ncbi:TonB-dependent receptor [Olivibacter sitiensis]|uniref:TonB-dependent receptor n=1 Tax=Olivibacter sitiensis TaxID=376470 RepID=UPI00042A6FC9|nr:TonB-dependent receptor [Olivibacter sitiensis]
MHLVKYTSILVFVLFAWATECVYAQHTVQGIVADSTGLKLQGATVRLQHKTDSGSIRQVQSVMGGAFTFTSVPEGAYIFSVRSLGYRTYIGEISVSANIKPIMVKLEIFTDSLPGVDIDVTPDVLIKGDTTEFNAAAFPTEPYADADALVVQLPGIEMDASGAITARGQSLNRIIVDGKEFFSTDPKVALKTLPADVISKVQLIEEKSEQSQLTGFDDGDRRMVLNIVTKPDRRHGYFGKIAGGGGSEERYNTGAAINVFDGNKRFSLNASSNNVNQEEFGMDASGPRGGRSGGSRGSDNGIATQHTVSLNYNNTFFGSMDLNANYDYKNRDNEVVTNSIRETLLGDNANQFRLANAENNVGSHAHALSFRAQRRDSIHRFTFQPQLSYTKNGSVNTSTNETWQEMQERLNASARTNENHSNNFALRGSLDYGVRLNRGGRSLSFHLDGNLSNNDSRSSVYSLNEFFSTARMDTVNNRGNTLGNGNTYNARASYTEPLSKSMRLMANYGLRSNRNYSDRETWRYLAETGQYDILDSLLSNEFRNEYTFHSAGASYQYTKGKALFDLGVDYQRAQMQNHRFFPVDRLTRRDFENYLPKANFTYRFSPEKTLKFNYNSRTNPPSINQLQDVINNQNPLNISTGNSNLKQETQQSFSLNYNMASRQSSVSLSAGINADFSANKVVNSTWIASRDTLIADGVLLGQGGQFTRPENVNGYYALRGNFSYGAPIKKLKLNMRLNTNLSQTHDVGYLNQQEVYSNRWVLGQGVSFNSRISQDIQYSASYNINYIVAENMSSTQQTSKNSNQRIGGDVTYNLKGFRVVSSFNYNINRGLGANYDRDFVLWNAALGKKLFKQQNAEITLTAFDLLKSNYSVRNSISERYIENSESNTLTQYFLLSFTYNLRQFGGSATGGDRGMGPSRMDRGRGQMGRP